MGFNRSPGAVKAGTLACVLRIVELSEELLWIHNGVVLLGQVLLLKKKREQKGEQKEKLNVTLRQETAQISLQKKLMALRLKEWLVIAGFALGAAALRVPMQAVPSAEPISFFSILAGWLFGKKKGFLVGASSLYISNFFVFGGQGIWTLYQALGFGILGFIGGFLGEKARVWKVLVIVFFGTLIYEIIVNAGSVFFFPYGLLAIFITALPFSAVHIISNLAFASLLPFAKKIASEKGGFDDKEICEKLLHRLNELKKVVVIRK